MNVRLKKEFQALFWPWVVAAGIGLLPLFNWLLLSVGLNISNKFIYFLANSTYVIGVALLAALPFGNEFQDRTLPMLLSQPCTRMQIWRDKLYVSSLAVLTLTLAHLLGYLPNWTVFRWDPKLAALYLFFGFGAGIFWSLVSRSILGGIMLCLFSQAAIFLLSYAFADPAYYTTGSTKTQADAYIFISSLVTTPVLLWFAWKNFSRLQLSGHWENEASPTQINPRKWGFTIFPNHPGRPIINLVLKELRLLRPVFFMIMLFSILWIAAAAGASYWPAKREVFTNIINGFSAVYIPIIVLLAGCVSLGEEKASGIHAVNLASPVSSIQQWFIKNGIATLTALSGTIFLFLLISQITGKNLDLIPLKILNESGSYLALCGALLFILVQISFWAATVANRIVHAAFLAVTTVVALATIFNIGMWAGNPIAALVQKPVYWLMAHAQLSRWYALNALGPAAVLSFLISCSSLIYCGFLCFRRLQSEKQNLIQSSRVPAVLVLSMGMIIGAVKNNLTDFIFKQSALYLETKAAIVSLTAKIDPDTDINSNSINFTFAELLTTEKLSPVTQKWLTGCTVSIRMTTTQNGTWSMAFIKFPSNDHIQPIDLSKAATENLPSLENMLRKRL